MNDIRISDMMKMQMSLWEKHRDTWSPMEPEYAKNFVLYMIEEVGECIAIIKKKGERAIADQPEVRAHFVEEMSDVLMYFTDTLLRFGITPEEISEAYIEKHCRNMGRDYDSQYREMYSK